MQLAEVNAKLKDVPEMGTAFRRLYREFAIQQKLFEVLVPMLEQAKIEEQRNTATLLILDKAVVAELPYRPKKRIIVTVFFLMAVVSSIATAFFIEKMRSLEKAKPTLFEDLRKGWPNFMMRRRTR